MLVVVGGVVPEPVEMTIVTNEYPGRVATTLPPLKVVVRAVGVDTELSMW